MSENRKVLAVDDDDLSRKMIALFLGPAYQVDTAQSGQEGLDRLPGDYGALITDLEMPPGIDGVQVLVGARNKGYAGLAFLCTGAPHKVPELLVKHGVPEEMWPAYCDGVISKPFSQAALLAAVNNAYKPI